MECDGNPPPPGRTDLDAEPEAPPSQQQATSAAHLRGRWANPAYRARISAAMAEKWQDPAYRARAAGNNRDDRRYRWRHLVSGQVVTRTKAEMHEEFGLKRDALSTLVAGRSRSSRGWALEPKPRMPAGPRWIFP